MDIEYEIGELKSLQRLVMERVDLQTDMLEDMKEILGMLVKLMQEPASSELSDALRGLTAVIKTLNDGIGALPKNVAAEVVRRMRAQ